MANSAGSAEAELETYQVSAEYLFNQFKETFTSIAQNAIKRDDLKNLIKFGTSMLEIVDGIVGKIGLIPTILTTAVGIISSKKLTNGGIFGINEKGKMTALGSQVGSGWWSSVKSNSSATKAQRLEIQEATRAVDDFHTAFKNGTMTTEQYNAALNHSNPIVRQYVQDIKAGTKESEAYKTATKQLGAGMQDIGIKGKLAAIGVQALNVATSMLISMGVGLVLSAIIKGFSDATHSIENHVNKISELKDKEKSLKSEIESLNTELSGVKTRIYELEKMPKLTLLEQDELNRLKESNDELERQIRLKQGELAKTASERNKEAQKLWETMQGGGGKTIKDWGFWDYFTLGMKPAIENGISSISTLANHGLFSQQTKALEKYKSYLDTINEIKNSKEYKNGSKELTAAVEAAQKELDKLHDKIQKYYNEQWIALSTGLDPTLNENKEILEQVNKVVDEWDRLNGKVDTTFEELYNNAKYSVVKNELEKLALAGELTAEKFEKFTDKDIKGIEEFREALESIGITDAEEIIESIIKKSKELANTMPDATDSTEDFTKSLEKLYEALDKVISKQEKLADAFKKVKLGSSLSAEEVYSLVQEMPDILKYLKPTSDGGYIISTDGFKAISNENLKEEKGKLQKSITETKTQIALLRELKEAALELNNSDGRDINLVNRFTKLSDVTEEVRNKLGIKSMGELGDAIDKLQESLNGDELYLDVITKAFDGYAIVDAYKDTKSVISDYNNDIKTLDNAIKSLNEGNLLAYEEMVEIVEIAPELQDFFDGMQGEYTISADKITEWREKSLESRNEYIQGLIEQAKTELQTAEKAKEAAEIVLNIQNQFGSATEQLAAQIDLEAAENKIKDILDVIEKYEALMGDIKEPDKKDDDLSKEMQNRIDYYKTILSAVEAVQDKYSEAIDKEIDALRESKDALKDANDERQRELDLIEARNNLENAKKRKVMVYSEGSGFKQVADQKAIKEAEEKYRGAITDIQEAEIDKQIDLLEKQKEAFERQNKDLTELENNIEKAKIINQAMQALGLTDEKDLLNLPNDVKEGIIKGLAETTLNKEKEDNKENTYYKPADLNDVLKSLGATVTAEDLKTMKNELPTEAVYNAAVRGFADSLKEFSREAVQNVTNNNGMVVSPTFNIYDASDSNKVAEVVNSEITNLLTRYNNSIK